MLPAGSAPVAAPVQGSATSEQSAEIAFWNSIKDSDNPRLFEAYVNQFPSGTFVAIAQIRLDALTKAAAAPDAQLAALPPSEPVPEEDPADALKVAETALGLSREDRRLVQRALNGQGHEAGAEDGLFGRGTRAAIAAWQVASYAEGTGYLTAGQATALIAAGREVQVAVGVYPEAPPGSTFKDCAVCPEMVVIPAGSFLMGSPAGDGEAESREKPQHRVTIGHPFALGKYEVTFAEWDACAAAGGCSHVPYDGGWGRGSRPVVNVIWDDAQDYVRRLSGKTGQRYRLPTEAEWEYAARAGTPTSRYWGDDIGVGNANCSACGSQWDDAQTAPVGSFRANGFGLHNVLGNVSEWLEDCWNDDYSGAPADGSAWTTGDCTRRVIRGGS